MNIEDDANYPGREQWTHSDRVAQLELAAEHAELLLAEVDRLVELARAGELDSRTSEARLRSYGGQLASVRDEALALAQVQFDYDQLRAFAATLDGDAIRRHVGNPDDAPPVGPYRTYRKLRANLLEDQRVLVLHRRPFGEATPES